MGKYWNLDQFKIIQEILLKHLDIKQIIEIIFETLLGCLVKAYAD